MALGNREKELSVLNNRSPYLGTEDSSCRLPPSPWYCTASTLKNVHLCELYLCYCLKWAFRLLSLPSVFTEIAIDIFIVMLPLSSDEQSRAYEERNEELFISLNQSSHDCICVPLYYSDGHRLGRKEDCCVFPEMVTRGDVRQRKGFEGFAWKAKIA